MYSVIRLLEVNRSTLLGLTDQVIVVALAAAATIGALLLIIAPSNPMLPPRLGTTCLLVAPAAPDATCKYLMRSGA